MLTCLTAILNGGAALFAGLAAAAWFIAASHPLPWFYVGGLGADSEAPAQNLGEIQAAIKANEGARRGAKWNRWAAICAGASAGMQAAALIIPMWP